MKKLIFTQLLIIVFTFTVIAQTADEQALLKFINDYDQVYMNNEIAFAERNLAEDYILVVDGERKTRAELFAEIRKEIAKPMTFQRDLRSIKRNFARCWRNGGRHGFDRVEGNAEG